MGKDKEKNRTKAFKKAVQILLIIGVVSFVAMSLYCCRYIHYMADDYSYMTANREIQEGNPTLSYLHVELWSAWSTYLHWQGVWFTNVLIYLLFGLQTYGLKVFQAVCGICDLLFFIALFYVVYEITSWFQTKERGLWLWGLTAGVLWTGLNTVSPAEELYWIDVVFSYTVPLFCGLFGIGLYLRFLRKGGLPVFVVGASVLGFLGSGGPLIGTSFFCAIYLLLALLDWSSRRRLVFRRIVPFLFTLAGALLNALAPGNFERHEAEVGAEYQLAHVLKETLITTGLRYRGLVTGGFVLGVCILLFVLVFTREEPLFETKWNPAFFWLWNAFTVYIMIFPFVLAYRLEQYLSDRVGYEVDLAAGALTVLCTIYTAQWLRNRLSQGECCMFVGQGKGRMLIALGALALVLNFALTDWSSAMIPNQVRELASGSCREYYEKVGMIYAEIENSPEEDVVITAELPRSKVLKELDVRTYADYWANHALARHYDKKTVSFEKAEY